MKIKSDKRAQINQNHTNCKIHFAKCTFNLEKWKFYSTFAA